ncbi:hypothetical protein FHY52_07815 [Nocardia nova]|uniref:hypothetical protein n=1 Tax=Nocardia nova TaxID=37330 RepID=UPI0025B21DF4|nr:hypothetical protein [Nocardia nova]MDN2496600.1 hypothetical protein [Nocardia nova]
MAAETVTLIVGVAAAVATLAVGALTYFKDRRDTRTQLLRDVELVERMGTNKEWHDALGISARVGLKVYVYERVHELAVREQYGRRAAKSLFVLGAAVVGIIVLTNNGDYHWLRTTAVWILWCVVILSAIRAFIAVAAQGRRRDELAPPNPPGTPPRQPSFAQRRRARGQARMAEALERRAAQKAAGKEKAAIRKQNQAAGKSPEQISGQTDNPPQ